MPRYFNMQSGVECRIRFWDGSKWAGGELASRAKANPPLTAPLKNILSRTSALVYPSSMETGDGKVVGTYHTIYEDSLSLSLEWDVNYPPFGSKSVEIPFAAAYSINDGPYKMITFNGSTNTNIVVPAEGTKTVLKADTISDNFLKGDVLKLYLWAKPSDPSSLVSDIMGLYPGEKEGFGSFTTAVESIHDAETYPMKNTWSARPGRGISNYAGESWIIGGDSIFALPQSWGDIFAENMNVPYTKTAHPGEKWSMFPTRWGIRYADQCKYGDVVVDELGVNDVTYDTALTATQVMQNAVNHWLKFKTAGIKKVIKPTITLNATTTDKWTSQTGQTAVRYEQRNAVNTWLRAGAPIINNAPVPVGTSGADTAPYIKPDGSIVPGSGNHLLTMISDVASAVENPSFDGKYSTEALSISKAYGTAMDGLHPNHGIHQLYGARLYRDVKLFGL